MTSVVIDTLSFKGLNPAATATMAAKIMKKVSMAKLTLFPSTPYR